MADVKPLSVARDLRRRRARERTGLFLAEGVRVVEELLDAELPLEAALVSPALSETDRGAAVDAKLHARAADHKLELCEVSDAELASAADTDSPAGVIVIARRPERSFEQLQRGERIRLVVLDAVQDPGNVGTILRSAAAFGISATIALPGTADLWNPKVVRAAAGALFRNHAFAASEDDLRDFCRDSHVTIWATSASGDAVRAGDSVPDRLAIVVGNEANGVSESLLRAAPRTVAIPIRGVESLNVAVATGILLYALSA